MKIQQLQPCTGQSKYRALQEKTSRGSTGLIFALAIVIVFLVLSAQYESYIDPIILLLTVPLAVLGAMTAIWLRSNIFMAGIAVPIQMRYNIILPGVGAQQCRALTGIPHVNENRYSIFPKVVDDIYCQVGLVTLIGFAAKNAILSWNLPISCMSKA